MFTSGTFQQIYLLITKHEPVTKKIIGFTITTDDSALLGTIEKKKPHHRYKVFLNPVEAEKEITSKLCFVDKFKFHLENGQAICINKWYGDNS